MFESAIKVKLIDFLLNEQQQNSILIANELAFADGSRRADLVTISDYLVAYEIKSEKDSLEKLPEQLKDYDKYFHSVYVVCHDSHLQNVRKLKGGFGIFTITTKGITKIRKARKRKIITTKYLLDHLDRSSLLSILRQKLPSKRSIGNIPVNELRSILEGLVTYKALYSAVAEHLRKIHQPSNNQFISERGKITVEEDLLLLKKASQTILN